jgi:hypothetical protein
MLLLSLVGVVLGLFMASDRRSRGPGVFFALWWVPGAATAGGVLLRDPVTFLVGLFCFCVAGVALALERRGDPGKASDAGGGRREARGSAPDRPGGSSKGSTRRRATSERARARELRSREYRKTAF